MGFPENCNRCGLCCSMTVRLTDEDVSRIRKHGHRDDEFLEQDADSQNVLKHQKNGMCVFFSLKDGVPSCGIYEYRPQRCDDFPFEKRCTFGNHPMFRVSDRFAALKAKLERDTNLKAPEK